MAISFKYWEDCVHPQDIESLWMDPQVKTEWLQVGETKGQKVHLSRDPDGQPFLTQTEIKAIADIVVRRHFSSQIDVDIILALAELESDRHILATRYNKKTKETTYGLLQVSPQIASWLFREHGYRVYDVEEQPKVLLRPFVNIYLGVAYVKCLSNFEHTQRTEEFVVRAFKGGVKKANRKSTLPYWRQYISIKENLPSRKNCVSGRLALDQNSIPNSNTLVTIDEEHIYWDSRTSHEDMTEMWNHPEVKKQWMKSRETQGQVRFSKDVGKGLYLTRIELKAVAEIVLSKHFKTHMIKPAILCAVAEIICIRCLNGVGTRIGLMGIDFPTAEWLHKELGYKAYRVESTDDLKKPFVSMYFGTAYLTWLSKYDGRERSPQFVVKAYLVGPKNVNTEETCPTYLEFEQELSNYGETKRESESCNIM